MPIFDPVGTNAAIKTSLVGCGWQANVPIPSEFKFLGTDIDFGKKGTVVEVQFSNYPFLLNNLLRSELFFRAKTAFTGASTELVVIVTKAGMFPASNSTLYFEQAVKQLDSLMKHRVFTVPIRLIGLFEILGKNTKAVWTEYENPRYSRTPLSAKTKTFKVLKDGTSSRCRIVPK